MIGKPMVSVVSFRAARNAKTPERKVDIYDVADGMSAKGWHLNALQDPAAIHIAVTLPITQSVDAMIRDLEDVVDDCKGKASDNTGSASALYGVAGSIPDKTIVRDLAVGFLDCLTSTGQRKGIEA
jgi:sphinganine-1-phosphate aldolase